MSFRFTHLVLRCLFTPIMAKFNLGSETFFMLAHKIYFMQLNSYKHHAVLSNNAYYLMMDTLLFNRPLLPLFAWISYL